MKNQAILLAERIVRPVDKALCDDISTALNIHFDPNSPTSRAITGLLGLLENRKYRPCSRTFRSQWTDVLVAMATWQMSTSYVGVHRSRLHINENTNDFDKMKHWGLIERRGGGVWAITKLGLHFVLGFISVPSRVHYRGDGVDGWHFKECLDYVTCRAPWSEDELARAEALFRRTDIPDGKPAGYVDRNGSLLNPKFQELSRSLLKEIR